MRSGRCCRTWKVAKRACIWHSSPTWRKSCRATKLRSKQTGRKLLELRGKVLAKLEVLRADKVIGKALEAEVTLLVSREDAWLPSRYVGALPELFNVSAVKLREVKTADPDYLESALVERSPAPKCERCWRFVAEVGDDKRFPTVCMRCATALEAIHFAPYDASSGEVAA